MNKINKVIFGGLLLVQVSSCTTNKTYDINHTTTDKPLISQQVIQAFESINNNNPVVENFKKGVKYLNYGYFANANDAFEDGLKLDPTNGQLHFYNALAYHMASNNVDTNLLDLAKTGYLTSLQFDEENYWAAYLLGRIYFDSGEYLSSQNQFSYALNYAPNNTSILNALSVSSYYVKDLTLSNWAATKAYANNSNDLPSLRSLMFTQAALGKSQQAKENFSLYKKMVFSNKEKPQNYLEKLALKNVSNRIQSWDNYHQLAQNDAFSSSNSSGLLNLKGINEDNYQPDISSADQQTASQPQPSEINTITSATTDNKLMLPNMTLVDVVIIRTQESKSQAKGINLLDGLKATLSGTMLAANKVTGEGASSSTTISPTLEYSGLLYNFNIFNSGLNKAEVLARPSLLAVENKTSKFYSGAVLHVQLSSNTADGSLVDIPVGITLNVTPKFYDKDTVEITVHAERSFLETVDENAGFTTFSQSSKTSVDATGILKFGQTLILSGLSQNEKNKSKTGVPFLQSIPIIQYFFSNDVEQEYKESILILLTPRKARYANENKSPNELAEDLKNQKDQQSKYVNELRKSQKVKTNIDASIAHLSENEYYRQFKSGDLHIGDWKFVVENSLKRALGFLYY